MTLEKYLTRDMSLFSVVFAMEGYTHYFKNIFDFNYKNLAYFCEEGLMTSYKDPEEIKKTLQTIKSKFSNIKNILKKHKQLFLEKEKLIDEILSYKKINNNLIKLIKKFYDINGEYWSYHLFTFHLLSAIKEKEFEELIEEKELILELRKTDPYGRIDEELLPHIFSLTKFKEKLELSQFISPDELIIYIKTKQLDEYKLNKRKNNYLINYEKRKIKIYSGSEAKKEFEKLNIKNEIVSNQLKGAVAFKGNVKGKVKVILRKDQFKDIKKDDILVAHMTTINYTPYLNKVKGIITDEGGLGCHAAIISREMKIPCIIGAKNATKILKTGDKVKLDAENGRIIKIQ